MDTWPPPIKDPNQITAEDILRLQQKIYNGPKTATEAADEQTRRMQNPFAEQRERARNPFAEQNAYRAKKTMHAGDPVYTNDIEPLDKKHNDAIPCTPTQNENGIPTFEPEITP